MFAASLYLGGTDLLISSSCFTRPLRTGNHFWCFIKYPPIFIALLVYVFLFAPYLGFLAAYFAGSLFVGRETVPSESVEVLEQCLEAVLGSGATN